MARLVYTALSCAGFCMTTALFMFVLTPRYLLSADYEKYSILEVFPLEWIRTFGKDIVSTGASRFHYFMAWSLIPTFFMLLHIYRSGFEWPFSYFLQGLLGCLFGCDWIVNWMLASRRPSKTSVSLPHCPSFVLPLYLFLNFASIICWYSFDVNTMAFVVAVASQALIIPISYCAIVSSKSTHVPKWVLLSHGLGSSIISVNLFFDAISRSGSLENYFEGAFNGFSVIMFFDHIILSLSATLFMLTESSQINQGYRMLCASLSIFPPLCPVAFCLFLALSQKSKQK
jgi:hypothetical protein